MSGSLSLNVYLFGLHFDKLGNSLPFLPFLATSNTNIEHIQKMYIYDVALKTSYYIFHYLLGIRLCSMVDNCLGF